MEVTERNDTEVMVMEEVGIQQGNNFEKMFYSIINSFSKSNAQVMVKNDTEVINSTDHLKKKTENNIFFQQFNEGYGKKRHGGYGKKHRGYGHGGGYGKKHGGYGHGGGWY